VKKFVARAIIAVWIIAWSFIIMATGVYLVDNWADFWDTMGVPILIVLSMGAIYGFVVASLWAVDYLEKEQGNK
jgi:hypothetical protein